MDKNAYIVYKSRENRATIFLDSATIRIRTQYNCIQ